MALRTKEEYQAAIRAMRPNVYKNGKLIEDVFTDPTTAPIGANQSKVYDLAAMPENRDLMVAKSYFTGEEIYRWNTIITAPEGSLMNSKFKRFLYRKMGTCTPGTCVGWVAINVFYATTYEMDEEYGTDYNERVKNWAINAERKGLMIAGSLTDAKGDRSMSPSQQPDLNSNVRITEYRPDGSIVVNGYKTIVAAAAVCDEICVLSGSAYKEAEKDWALAFAVPRDIEGLTIVQLGADEPRKGWDAPVTGVQSSYLFFDNVVVPRERVFLAGEYKYTGANIGRYTANYRSNIGACVAGQGDVMIGAAMLMARLNGLSRKTFQTELTEMALGNNLTYGLGLGAILSGAASKSGVWFADSNLGHTTKHYVANIPYETKRICQEIGGGIVEVGCLPSYTDCTDPVLGPKIMKAIKASYRFSGESRARAARLTEWLTIGAGIPGCMHGGGSPGGARLVVNATTPWEELRKDAQEIAGITEDITDPPKKK